MRLCACVYVYVWACVSVCAVGVTSVDLCRWVRTGKLQLRDWIDSSLNSGRDRLLSLTAATLSMVREHFRRRGHPNPHTVHKLVVVLSKLLDVRSVMPNALVCAVLFHSPVSAAGNRRCMCRL